MFSIKHLISAHEWWFVSWQSNSQSSTHLTAHIMISFNALFIAIHFPFWIYITHNYSMLDFILRMMLHFMTRIRFLCLPAIYSLFRSNYYIVGALSWQLPMFIFLSCCFSLLWPAPFPRSLPSFSTAASPHSSIIVFSTLSFRSSSRGHPWDNETSGKRFLL